MLIMAVTISKQLAVLSLAWDQLGFSLLTSLMMQCW